ncbi:probable N-acetyltransferase camello [Clupea harengus]|uniref:Probable N-acetyltransferase camello n=1 Tax=Clupea harengus TaxID=7950 RepID=A0A6P3VVJ9_CLUHA|nr:probable N-acetyltransferase camello [Clupea harengus]
MAGMKIRSYEDDDDEAVKEIFTMGMSEHVPSSFVHLLKQPLMQMLCVCVFCTLMATSKSILLPVLAVTLLLAGGRQLVSYLFNSYIDESMRRDLNKVRETYMSSPNTCFWVAESDGLVVATVACLPAERHPECLELKRMSVRRSHRGQGIAKAMCHTVAGFARSRGYQGVVLYTSMVQTDAQHLYEHVGYKRMRQFVVPEFFAKITNFSIIEYRLEVQPSPQ